MADAPWPIYVYRGPLFCNTFLFSVLCVDKIHYKGFHYRIAYNTLCVSVGCKSIRLLLSSLGDQTRVKGHARVKGQTRVRGHAHGLIS